MSVPPRTVTVTDPCHEMYGRVGVVLDETEWYTTIRILYTSHREILSKEQYRNNITETS